MDGGRKDKSSASGLQIEGEVPRTTGATGRLVCGKRCLQEAIGEVLPALVRKKGGKDRTYSKRTELALKLSHKKGLLGNIEGNWLAMTLHEGQEQERNRCPHTQECVPQKKDKEGLHAHFLIRRPKTWRNQGKTKDYRLIKSGRRYGEKTAMSGLTHRTLSH